jgi:hypothetical protein
VRGIPPILKPRRVLLSRLSAPTFRRPKPAEPPRSPVLDKRKAGLQPLNFQVPADFRREFKTYAASHDLKLNELLKRAFESYRRQQSD